MGRLGKAYAPLSSAVTTLEIPVLLFVSVTTALGTTAPLESLTLPEMLPPTPAQEAIETHREMAHERTSSAICRHSFPGVPVRHFICSPLFRTQFVFDGLAAWNNR